MPNNRMLTRISRRAGWTLFGVIAAAAVAWSVVQPKRIPPEVWVARRDADPNALSILTYNVSRGGHPTTATLDAIGRASPDIVCMQELTPAFAAAFEGRFDRIYPYRVFAPGPSVHGIGLASRFPISKREILRDGMAFLPAALGSISFDGAVLNIMCMHLMPPHARIDGIGDAWQAYRRNRETRLAQAGIAIRKLATSGQPAVILGDMNEFSGQAALAFFRNAAFLDACDMPGAECAATWPGALVPLPAIVRIDHILGKGVRFADSAVLDAGGSDHYPMAATIAGTTKPLESRTSSSGN